MSDNLNPVQSLDAIRESRLRMARSLETYPKIYDWLFAGLFGVLVAWQGLPQQWAVFGIFLTLGFAIWAQRWWKKRFGWWVDAYTPKKARWVAFAMVPLLVALMGGSLWGREYGPWWLCLVTGALSVPLTIFFARWWARVWKRELEQDL